MWKDFKGFILRGNVLDLAVGVIIGIAFGAVVQSLVNDIIMPPIGLLLGRVDFTNLFVVLRQGDPNGPYQTLEAANAAGAVTINYGIFINTVISLLLVGLAVFLLVRLIESMRRKEEPTPAKPAEKLCVYCKTSIPDEAVRCPHCTSELEAAAPAD
jgi:large conductance mechanosensitive channel